MTSAAGSPTLDKATLNWAKSRIARPRREVLPHLPGALPGHKLASVRFSPADPTPAGMS